MSTQSISYALLVTDRLPFGALAGALHLAGYDLDLVDSVDGAVLTLNRRVPDVVVAGPFRRPQPGLSTFLRKLGELHVHVVVITEDDRERREAEALGVIVHEPAWERSFASCDAQSVREKLFAN